MSLKPELLEAELDSLLDLDAAARQRALDAIAAKDPARAAELRRWLQAIVASEGLLESAADSAAIPQRVGAWALAGLIGRGGSGEVYFGRRADGAFEREVAIKLLRPDRMADARIVAERRLLARLQHPNIAALLDGGMSADGRPFLITEYVAGDCLDRWLQTRQPGLSLRLQVFRALAEAVAYAHAHGVIHADLKPANVLITADDQPKLLDFSIARGLQPGDGGVDGSAYGLTPAYAAPEQFSGAEPTQYSDIYALGLLLHLMLTGVLPVAGETLTLAELVAVRQRPIVKLPSALIDAAGSGPISARQLRGDLDAIVLRCLRTEPGTRYPSVQALLADLECWRLHLPVQAREGGYWYRARRFLRRHWWSMGLAAVAAISLLAGSVAALWQAQRATRAELEARATTAALGELINGSDLRTVRNPANEVRQWLRDAVQRIEGQPAAPQVDTGVLVLLGNALLSHEDFAGAQAALRLADQRGTAVAPPLAVVERESLRAELAMAPLDFRAARQAVERAKAALGTAPLPEALALVEARLLVREGAFERARGHFAALIAARAARDGAQHPRTLAARLWWLEALRIDRRREAVIREGEALLADVRAHLPPEHALLPAVLTHIAFAQIGLHGGKADGGGLERAEQYLTTALARALALYGERSLAAINARDGLALIRKYRGDVEGHLAQLEQVLAAERALFGADSTRAALSAFHYGMTLYLAERRAEGRAAIDAAEAAVAASHALKELSVIRQQYALLLIRGGEYAAGLQVAERAALSLAQLESPALAMQSALHRARAEALLAQGQELQALAAAQQAVRDAAQAESDREHLQRRSLQQRLRVELKLRDWEAAGRSLAALQDLGELDAESQALAAALAARDALPLREASPAPSR